MSSVLLSEMAEITSHFEQHARHTQSWLLPVQRSAIERFRNFGLPTTRLEAWRYTNMQKLASVRFGEAKGEPVSERERALIDQVSVPGVARLVVISGRLDPYLSDLERLPQGLSVTQLDDGTHLLPLATKVDQSLTILNTALLDDALEVTTASAISEPLVVIYLNQPEILSHPRTLVTMRGGGRLELMQIFVGESGWQNPVTEITVDKDAELEHLVLHEGGGEELTTHATRGRVAGVYRSTVVAHAGRLTRNEIDIDLCESGANATLNGLGLAGGSGHVDLQTTVRHSEPDCHSAQLYKTVLDDNAVGVFNGRVIVPPDAQGTRAFQKNRNLLLAEKAVAYTKPQLEIEADDVRCSHGATVGQLDEDALFYLRARGLDERAARRALVSAFAGEILEVNPWRQHLEGRVGRWMEHSDG